MNNLTELEIQMDLIKQANKTVKNKDPVEEALEQVAVTEALSKTFLSDEQINELANHINDLLKNFKAPDAIDAAYMALEDVPGFETASHPVLKLTVKRIVDAYHLKFK